MTHPNVLYNVALYNVQHTGCSFSREGHLLVGKSPVERVVKERNPPFISTGTRTPTCICISEFFFCLGFCSKGKAFLSASRFYSIPQ